MTVINPLRALSPLDGRYLKSCQYLSEYFSEFALIRNRVRVEIAWLIALSEEQEIVEVATFSEQERALLCCIITDFSDQDAEQVKAHERVTNHDVKAVEYYLKDKLAGTSLETISEFVHFACTSEDINNTAWGLSLLEVRPVLIKQAESICKHLREQAVHLADCAMLAKTHGQPASPTTMGKELANVAYRMERQIQQVESVLITAKMNGATGNYNAHICAYPEVDWEAFSQKVVRSLGMHVNPWTTQIEPHDFNAEYFHALMRLNTILIDLSRDIWGYISFGLFKQKTVQGEVGSSVMPHKVNPIDFENAEGNLGLANALLAHLSEKLPVSRFQRDLTDSTVQRNMGVALGYAQLGWTALQRGLHKLQINHDALQAELDSSPEVLTEAIQTVMRRYGIESPYEKLKALSRGNRLGLDDLRSFVRQLAIPEEAKQRLLMLTPNAYIGNAADKAKQS